MRSQTSSSQDPPPFGFTLIELLVVIAIIGILVALLLPAVQAAREAGRRSQCSNNLKQVGIALHNYHDAHKTLPFGSAGNLGVDATYTKTGTWAAFILPFVEAQTNFDLFNFNLSMADPANAAAAKQYLSVYVCPSDGSSDNGVLTDRNGVVYDNPAIALGAWYVGSMGPTHMDDCSACLDTVPSLSNPCCQGYNFGSAAGYGMPKGTFAGVMARYRRSIRFAEIRDGLSHTLAAGETLPRQCSWNSAFATNFCTTSTNIPLNTFISDSLLEPTTPMGGYTNSCGFKSRHPGGVQFVVCDGSVHFIAAEIDPVLLNMLGTRAGGELAALP